MSIERERYGVFGIASADGISASGYYAWGRYGDTVANTVMDEPTEPVWFTFGETREQAVALLKAELNQVEPQPGSIARCNGVSYIVRGVASGAGTSRLGRVIVYADPDTGRLFYRTPANFAERMHLIEPGQ